VSNDLGTNESVTRPRGSARSDVRDGLTSSDVSGRGEARGGCARSRWPIDRAREARSGQLLLGCRPGQAKREGASGETRQDGQRADRQLRQAQFFRRVALGHSADAERRVLIAGAIGRQRVRTGRSSDRGGRDRLRVAAAHGDRRRGTHRPSQYPHEHRKGAELHQPLSWRVSWRVDCQAHGGDRRESSRTPITHNRPPARAIPKALDFLTSDSCLHLTT
jgi:hypothetical protein